MNPSVRPAHSGQRGRQQGSSLIETREPSGFVPIQPGLSGADYGLCPIRDLEPTRLMLDTSFPSYLVVLTLDLGRTLWGEESRRHGSGVPTWPGTCVPVSPVEHPMIRGQSGLRSQVPGLSVRFSVLVVCRPGKDNYDERAQVTKGESHI